MILIGLGSNLAGPFESSEALLREAVRVLDCERAVTIRAASGVWLSAPVPASDQPWYRNAVIDIETAYSAEALLSSLQAIEQRFGRVRSAANAARTLDLDLLDFRGEIRDTSDLVLPHPRMHLRAFVLRPLAQIAPRWVHAVSGATLDDLIAALPPDQSATPMDGVALR